MLFIVPTPVGNLQDMTFRAIETLKSVDLILAEDTRTSGVLLQHFDIHTPLKSHHKFNEHETSADIVERLKAGANIALISDAGTPAISDPGFFLVRAAAEADIEIQCLPGATAFVPALVDSGLPNNHFYFEGFLPQKKGRQTRLQYLAQLDQTFIIYESPFRLVKTLEQLAAVCGNERKASVSREISKVHEETVRGSLAELIAHFTVKAPKGEIVLIVEGRKSKVESDECNEILGEGHRHLRVEFDNREIPELSAGAVLYVPVGMSSGLRYCDQPVRVDGTAVSAAHVWHGDRILPVRQPR